MKNITDKVSIIIPIYNGAKYIDRCLESVINQSYKNIEVLLIVGKCTDNSLGKCIEWQSKDDRIIILSRADSSLGDARNYGLKIATGEFISYIDIDDFVESNFIELLVRPLQEDGEIDLSCCGFDRYYSETMIIQGWAPSLDGVRDVDFDMYNALILVVHLE